MADSSQLAAAKRLIHRCVRVGQSQFVAVTVTLEPEWLLRATYGFARDDGQRVLSNLLSAAAQSIESERALDVALPLGRQARAGFADGLHMALAAATGEQPRWPLDR